METQNFEPAIRLEIHAPSLTQPRLAIQSESKPHVIETDKR